MHHKEPNEENGHLSAYSDSGLCINGNWQQAPRVEGVEPAPGRAED